MLAKEGSIVDASFVAAPKQRNSRERERAKSKRATALKASISAQRRAGKRTAMLVGQRRAVEVHYGYKNHVKVDADKWSVPICDNASERARLSSAGGTRRRRRRSRLCR